MQLAAIESEKLIIGNVAYAAEKLWLSAL